MTGPSHPWAAAAGRAEEALDALRAAYESAGRIDAPADVKGWGPASIKALRTDLIMGAQSHVSPALAAMRDRDHDTAVKDMQACETSARRADGMVTQGVARGGYVLSGATADTVRALGKAAEQARGSYLALDAAWVADGSYA